MRRERHRGDVSNTPWVASVIWHILDGVGVRWVFMFSVILLIITVFLLVFPHFLFVHQFVVKAKVGISIFFSRSE